jgi:hypothetical protein
LKVSKADVTDRAMVDIHVSCGRDPHALAELIAATLHGLIPEDPTSPAVRLGRAVRAKLETIERMRSSRHDVETLNFARLDPDDDWTQV